MKAVMYAKNCLARAQQAVEQQERYPIQAADSGSDSDERV
jgi:hypothetical protein